jgi:2-oxoisovalerate dehydrogenase E1 component
MNTVTDEHFKKALLIRRTEDTFLDLFNQGKMNGTVHTCSGQEFSALAFTEYLRDDDLVVSNHRCHGHYIAKTGDLEGLILELIGKETGTCAGIGSSQHLYNDGFYSNGVQGGIVPVAAGMAMAAKRNKKRNIVVVFIGDGTLGEGVVYETLNLISLYQLPLLIVCENNFYAQSTNIKDSLSGDIISRAKAFGIKTSKSNTWNLEELFKNAEDSINAVRSECKPFFHLVETYRLNHHSKSDDNRDQSEVNLYYDKDPLNIFKKTNYDKFNSFLAEINTKIGKILLKSENDNEISGEDYSQVNYFSEAITYSTLEEFDQRVVNRLNSFFDEVMSLDKKVLFIGEDILSPYGGAFKVSKDLSAKYPENVISTPISESSISGMSNGLALAGFKPWLEIMFGDFMTLCLDQIINHASKFHHMYNKQVNCPVVFRTPMGGGRGYGPTHSQTLDKFLVGIDNILVIAINSFIDPKEICNTIYSSEINPTILIENKLDYGNFVGRKINNSYYLEKSSEKYPSVRCLPLDSNPDLTIVSYGGIASDIFNSLDEIFLETELIPELIVLSKISPLDIKPILDSVRKTGRLIFIEEGGKSFGIGAELIALTFENLGSELKFASRIGALPVPIPSSRKAEHYVLPNFNIATRIANELKL